MLTRAFRIDADDSSTGGMPAMSRPPSRVDSGKPIVDLSGAHAEGRRSWMAHSSVSTDTPSASASNVLSLKEQEDMNDPEMQRAVAESMRDCLPEQENGITATTTGPHFGPAHRAYYDPSSWALTTFSTSREIIDHPPASKRRRIRDEPAFLRGSPDTDYVAALLTIYHSIPLAREALLMPSLRVLTYGYDSSWWSGTSNENTKSLATDSSVVIDPDSRNLLAEIQCLMAFLDHTDRAYGSVDALADLQKFRTFEPETPFTRLLEAWRDAALAQSPDEPLTQIFNSVAMKDPGFVNSPPIEKNLVSLETPVNRIPGQTIVDLLDHTVWNDTAENIDDVWIDQCADVFTMRLFDPGLAKEGLGLSASPTWYPDRYLYELRDVTRQMRREMQVLRREIDQCTAIQRRCEFVQGPDRRILKIRDILDAASKASVAALGEKATPASNGFYDSHRAPSSSGPFPTADVREVGSELQNTLRRIERKLNALEQRKCELRTEMRKIALALTQPSSDRAQPQPHRRYVLQGVSTKPEIMYLRRRPRQDLMELETEDLIELESDGDEDDGHHRGPPASAAAAADAAHGDDWEWWRISWRHDELPTAPAPRTMIGPVTQAEAEAGRDHHGEAENGEEKGSRPYRIKKVEENDVLAAIRWEHNCVVLVYASDRAMAVPPSKLNVALKHFIDQDNQAFAEELREEQRPGQQSEDDTDVGFEDVVPLGSQVGPTSTSTRQATPMSMSSPATRDEDGQPSPKRAKEHDFRDEEVANQPLPLPPPPSYEESVGGREMQERKGNKIGLYAEQMLRKYGHDLDQDVGGEDEDEDGSGRPFMHIEHSTDGVR